MSTKPIKTSYSPSAGTAYITFDNVKVPVENTLGEEGGGIFVMLSNFNHERWVMCCTNARGQRAVVEECMKCVSLRFHSCPILTLLRVMQVGKPAQGVWQAASLARGHPKQARCDDLANRECAELAGEHHLPDVQHGM